MTEQTQDRIVAFGEGNVIVSASAGCGKTTTMIRRILNLILERKCGVDELLVVTFTNAAAAEMREKLNAALKSCNDNDYVLAQLFQLESADICTIDSFCSRVVRKYFYEAEADPDFEIAEGGEAAMWKLRAAESVIAEGYASGDPVFAKLADVFSGDRTDRELTRMLMRLVDLSANFADRESFLTQILPDGCRPGGRAEAFITTDISDTLSAFRSRFRELSEGSCAPGDRALCETLSGLLSERGFTGSIDGWRAFFDGLVLPPLPRLKSGEREDIGMSAAHERLRAVKKSLSETVKRFREKYLCLTEEELHLRQERLRPLLRELARLASETAERFSAYKAKNAMLDFDDVERCAYRILQKDSVRSELLSRYRYVFLDEAQDINHFQEELLGLLTRGDNAFLVGDVKQCIYRFRGAKPEIFAERCRLAGESDGFFRLSENFRTNADLLAFVNRVFDGCMRGNFCSVDYPSSERLAGKKSGRVEDGRPAVVCNFSPPPTREKRHAEGLYRVNPEPEESEDAEGLTIADEITELVYRGRIWEEGALRPIRYSDIAVLVRGKKTFSDSIRRTLKEAGIPLACDFEYPILHYPEITTLLDYLRVIDNFEQDIPLLSALSSCFGGFSAAELALIRVRHPDSVCRSFSRAFLLEAGEGCKEDGGAETEALSEAAAALVQEVGPADGGRGISVRASNRGDRPVPPKTGGEGSDPASGLGEKCCSFLERTRRFRRISRYRSCFELIGEIVRVCDYDIVLEREGEGKRARLESFLASIENRAYAGSLSRFLKFIDQFADSFLLAERNGAADAVLVTTIHKSKGLEYPIVFLAGLDGTFNRMDQRNLVNVDLTLGGGMDFYDRETRRREELPTSAAVKRSIRYNTVRDELNLLYVAMTRAKYRLYLSGTRTAQEGESFCDPRDAGCFLDFILPALPGSGAEVNDEACAEPEQPHPGVPVYRTDLAEYLPWFEAGCDGGSEVPVKSTVTELNRLYEEQIAPQERCAFAEYSEISQKTGTDFRKVGNAYHKYLEFGNTHIESPADLAADLERLRGTLEEEELALLDLGKLYAFHRNVYRNRRPAKILREQPFLMSLAGGETGDPVLVQGKIDLLLVYEDGIEIVDYKFSRLDEASLLGKYRRQVELYCMAAERCTGLPVRGAWLYSFGSDRLIEVPPPQKSGTFASNTYTKR